MWDLIQIALMAVYGSVIAVGLLVFVYWRHAHFWRDMVEVYGGEGAEPVQSWHMQSVYLHEGGLVFNSHRAFITIRLCEDGVSFGTFFPLSMLFQPIFVPHQDILVRERDWLLMGPCCELEFRGLPDLKMVIPTKAGEVLLDREHPLFRRMPSYRWA